MSHINLGSASGGKEWEPFVKGRDGGERSGSGAMPDSRRSELRRARMNVFRPPAFTERGVVGMEVPWTTQRGPGMGAGRANALRSPVRDALPAGRRVKGSRRRAAPSVALRPERRVRKRRRQSGQAPRRRRARVVPRAAARTPGPPVRPCTSAARRAMVLAHLVERVPRKRRTCRGPGTAPGARRVPGRPPCDAARAPGRPHARRPTGTRRARIAESLSPRRVCMHRRTGWRSIACATGAQSATRVSRCGMTPRQRSS